MVFREIRKDLALPIPLPTNILPKDGGGEAPPSGIAGKGAWRGKERCLQQEEPFYLDLFKEKIHGFPPVLTPAPAHITLCIDKLVS